MLENTNHYPEENNPFDVSGIQRALRHLLEDFSDEVPSEMIFGQTLNKEGRDYKVRKNWFATIANLFYLLRIEANMEEDLESKSKLSFSCRCHLP